MKFIKNVTHTLIRAYALFGICLHLQAIETGGPDISVGKKAEAPVLQTAQEKVTPKEQTADMSSATPAVTTQEKPAPDPDIQEEVVDTSSATPALTAPAVTTQEKPVVDSPAQEKIAQETVAPKEQPDAPEISPDVTVPAPVTAPQIAGQPADNPEDPDQTGISEKTTQTTHEKQPDQDTQEKQDKPNQTKKTSKNKSSLATTKKQPAAITPAQESKEKKSKKPEKQKYLLNEIRAVVYGSGPMTEPGQTVRPALTVLILTRDITRPWIDGQPRTLRDLVLENLMIFDAQRINQSIPDEDIDKVLNQIQKSHNMTHEQLEDQMKMMGYTFDEFREELRRKQLIDRIVEYRVHGDKRLAVSQADIESYWKEFGPTQEATYELSDALIKTTDKREDFEKKLKNGEFDKSVEWKEPIKVTQSELPKDKLSVTEKNAGDIAFIEPVADGFEITKLVSKTAAFKVPLKTGNKEEDAARATEITQQLKQKRFVEIMESYQADLLAQAKIDFKYAKDRDEVMGTKK